MNTKLENNDDEDWIQETMHRWAEHSPGELSRNALQRVTRRIESPASSHPIRPILVAVMLLLILSGMGWWLFGRPHGQETVVFSPLDTSKGGLVSHSVVDEPLSTGTTDKSAEPIAQERSEEVKRELRLVVEEMKGLQIQLSLVQLNDEFQRLERELNDWKEEIAKREAQWEKSSKKLSIISDWLANQ